MVADQQGGQLGLAQAQADPVAGDPRLGDLELRLANPVPVPDAHLVVGQAVDGEVLPEHAVAEAIAAEVPLPVPVGLDLVHQHGTLLTAMAVQVALAVAVDVQPPHHPRPGHRVLPHTGVDGLALPGHVLRHPDVYRQQHRRPVMPVRREARYSARGDAGHGCLPGGASSSVRFRSMPCGITVWPGSSLSRVPSRCTSTLSGSKETRPEMRRTSGQAS